MTQILALAGLCVAFVIAKRFLPWRFLRDRSGRSGRCGHHWSEER